MKGWSVNRTVIRGIAASTIGGALLVAAGVAGTALAQGRSAPPPALAAMSRPGGFDQPAPAAHIALVRVALRASRAQIARLPLTSSPRSIARVMVRDDGWSDAQWSCLDTLWTRESRWRVSAHNLRSGAYGIPQALPGWKMSLVASDWRTNAVTQIRWGLWYISRTYGSPCGALWHSNRYGFY